MGCLQKFDQVDDGNAKTSRKMLHQYVAIHDDEFSVTREMDVLLKFP
jgi:hypothetical protein